VKEAFRMRSWAGPLTIGSFFVVAMTGILMFFHMKSGLMTHVHELTSWLFVIGAIAHIIVNWRYFLAYFRKPVGVAIIVIFVVIGVFSIVPQGGSAGHPPIMKIYDSLEQSSLNVVAQVAKRDLQTIVDELKSRGIQVSGTEQTIVQIAVANKKRSMDIIAIILSDAGTTVSANPHRGEG
jgi:hypothetical protein